MQSFRNMLRGWAQNERLPVPDPDEEPNGSRDFNAESGRYLAEYDGRDVARKSDHNEYRSQRQHHVQLTQSGVENLAPVLDLGEPVAENDLNDFYKHVKRTMGVKLHAAAVSGERLLYIGAGDHADLVKRFNENYAGQQAEIRRFETLLGNVLDDEDEWDLLMQTTKSRLGDQDSFIRALVLSRLFQRKMIDLLLAKMDDVATARNFNEEQMVEFGGHLVEQLRYVEQLSYPSDKLVEGVFGKRIVDWAPPLRETFVAIIPELFIEQSSHGSVLLRLKDLMLQGTDRKSVEFRQAILKSMSLLTAPPDRARKVRNELLRRIMEFEPPIVAAIVQYLLSGVAIDDRTAFRNTYITLRKRINFEQLRMTRSSVPLDGIVCSITQSFVTFMRVSVSKSVKDFQICLLTDRTQKDSAGNEDAPADGEEGDMPDASLLDDPLLGDGRVTPGESEEVPVEHASKLRELELFDILCLIALYSIKPDVKLSVQPFRAQILKTHRRVVRLKDLMETAMSYKKFGHTFFDAAIAVSRDLIVTGDRDLAELGGVILYQLFVSQNHDNREVVIGKLKSYLNEVDSEATVVMKVLESLVDDPDHHGLLSQFMPELTGFTECLANLKVHNVRRLFFVLLQLNTKQRSLAQYDAVIDTDPLMGRIRCLTASTSEHENIWGVVGLLMHLKVTFNMIKKAKASRNTAAEERFEQCVTNALAELDTAAAGKNRVRSAFYTHFRELLIASEEAADSPAIAAYLDELFNDFKSKFFLQLNNGEDNNFPKVQLNDPKYLNPGCKTWINMNELVEGEPKGIEGRVTELIPELLLLKAYYDVQNKGFHANATDRSVNLTLGGLSNSGTGVIVGGSEATHRWNDLLFVLEANIRLPGLLADMPDKSPEARTRRCNILCAASEWIRTILNAFGAFKGHTEDVDAWMCKKFKLLYDVETHLQGTIKRLGTYTLPKLSTYEREEIVVTSKTTGKRKKPRAQARGDQSQGPDEDQRGGDDAEHGVADETAASDELGGARNVIDDSIVLVKPAKNSIPVEKLFMHSTSLRIDAICRVLKTLGLKRKCTRFLIDALELSLQTLLKTVDVRPSPINRARVVPQVASGLTQPLTHYWTSLTDAIPDLFDILSSCASFFRENEMIPNDEQHREYDTILCNVLRIFTRIFQSKDIRSEVDVTNLDDSAFSMQLRSAVMQKLYDRISVDRLSRLPMNADSTRTSDGTVVDHEERIVEYFLVVAQAAKSLDAAVAVLGLLKSFTSATGLQREKIAKQAIQFLRTDWTLPTDSNGKPVKGAQTTADKSHLSILGDYFDLRSDADRLRALLWVVAYKLKDVLPEESPQRRKLICPPDVEQDSSDIVDGTEDMEFPFITKRSFAAVHRLLFQKLNATITGVLRLDDVRRTRIELGELAKQWRAASHTYFMLCGLLRAPEVRSMRLVHSCLRESRRFLQLFCSMQSSFRPMLLKRDNLKRCPGKVFKIVSEIQLGNSALQGATLYAKAKKYVPLLKLLPDFKATTEQYIRVVQKAAVDAGIDDLMRIGVKRTRDIDGQPLSHRNNRGGNDDGGDGGRRRRSAAAARGTQNKRRRTNDAGEAEPQNADDEDETPGAEEDEPPEENDDDVAEELVDDTLGQDDDEVLGEDDANDE